MVLKLRWKSKILHLSVRTGSAMIPQQTISKSLFSTQWILNSHLCYRYNYESFKGSPIFSSKTQANSIHLGMFLHQVCTTRSKHGDCTMSFKTCTRNLHLHAIGQITLPHHFEEGRVLKAYHMFTEHNA